MQPLSVSSPAIQVSQRSFEVPVKRPGRGGGGALDSVFDIGSIDEAPRIRRHVPPRYPFEMRRKGVVGAVTVEFVVDREGNVLRAVATASTAAAFEEPAISAVKVWKFRPGRQGGQVVNTRVRQVIHFNLEAAW